jgi:rod shape-determining protein MreD
VKKYIFLLIIIGLAMFQVTILDYFKIFSVKPDLLLISAVICALFFKFRLALLLGVFAGILKDIFGGYNFGVNTLLFTLWTFLVIKLSKKISLDNNFIRMLLIFIIAIFENIIHRLIMLSSGGSIPPGIFLRIAILSSFYTACLLPLMLRIIRPVLFITE